MKAIKRIFIALIFLIIVALIAAVLLPREMRVRESKLINAPVTTVYNFLNDFKNQPQWNPWATEDKTMQFNYSANTVGKGAAYDWTSENSGEGSQLILETVKNESITSEIQFVGMGEAVADYLLEDMGDGKTKLTWKFKSEVPYPFNLINFYSKNQVSKSFKRGLKSIEEVTNDRYINNKYNGYRVEVKEGSKRSYLVRRAEVPVDNVSQYYTQQLPALYHKLQVLGLESMEKPSILYFSNVATKGNVDVGAGVMIANDTIVSPDNLKVVNLPAGPVVEIDYQGEYKNIQSAHNALSAYMSDKGLLKKYPLLQEPVSDSSNSTDPSKWVTKVIYYIAE